MADVKPQQFVPKATGNLVIDQAQKAIAQTTDAVRQAPLPSQTVTSLSKSQPGQGIMFKPGQIVDVPHNLGRVANGFNIAKVITNTNRASSAPAAVPNLQVVEVPNALGQKVMRLRYIPPKDSAGNDILDPVRLHLEIL